MKKIKEEKKQKEDEEYNKWKDMIKVGEEGEEKMDFNNEEVINKFLDYIKIRKVVSLEDISDILFEKSSENESLKNDNFLLKIIITRKDDKIHNMEKDIKYMKTEAQKFASEFDEFKKNIH